MRAGTSPLGPPPRGARRGHCPCIRSPVPDRPPSFPVAAWRGFKRLTQLGLPRRFPIVQFPNEPLIAAIVAGPAARYLHGLGHAYAMAIADLGIAIWAYGELTQGVNWFRRLLGLVFTIITVMTVAKALAA
jgi:hypothetical protein